MNTEKEQKLKKAYKNYLDLIMYDFPLEKMTEIVADDVKGYGSTRDEKFLEISRLKKMIINQREQGDGAKMQFTHLPVHQRISPDEDNAIYMDEISISLVVENEKNVIPLRLTSVFEFIENSWKLIHIHGSMAVETEEGDTWHINEWKQKQAELEKQVQEKTAELVTKNKELKIETALDKVRASALSMNETADMLEVCKTISEQLKFLGVNNIRNVQTAIVNESKQTYVNYEYYKRHDKSIITEVDYRIHPVQYEFAATMIKSPDSYFSKSFEGDELKKWIDSQKNSNQYFDTHLLKAKSVHYYFYSIGPVAMGISSYSPLSEHEIQLFKRFINVFKLAYKRFEDIKLALEQAREAQIEAAMERIRNRTLLMKSSKELNEAVAVFFNEFKNLNLLPPEARTYFCDINTNNHTAEVWMTETNGKVMKGSHFTPLNKSASLKKYYEAWRNKLPISERVYTGKTLKDYLDFVSTLSHVKKDKDYQKIFKSPPKKLIMTDANFLQGNIGIMTFEKLSREALTVLKRFAKVFEFTYTRFLDLQKAEAQAREAEIQLALERVRARTMAMQKSDELENVAMVLFEQVKQLGIKTWSTGINIWLEGNESYIDWVVSTTEGRFMEPYKVDLTVHPFFMEISKARKRGDDFFMIEAEGEVLKEHYRLLFEMAKIQFEDLKKAGFQMPKRQINHYVFGKKVSLMFITFDPCPEAHEIFKRLGKAFEQTYTRFLDLQKAEAQAHEAQIEAALEKVRSRSLAMHKSDELQNVVSVVFEQLQNLDFALDGAAFIAIPVKNFKGFDFWMEDKITKPACFRLPYYDAPSINDIYDGLESGKDFIANIYGKEKNIWFEYAFGHTDLKIVPEDRKKWVIEQDYLTQAFAVQKNSALGIHVHHKKNITDNEIDILKRFSQVFEQGYIRFLDLQKAEAQAREAQIEAALEKVRSRSLAMHSGDELGDVVTLIVEKLKDLGVVLDANGVVLCTYFNDSKDVMHWISSPDFTFAGSYFLPYFDHPIFNDAWNSKESGDEYFSKAFSVEEKNSFFEYAFEHSDYKNFPDDFKEWVFQNDQHILSFAWQKKSAILIPSHTGVVPSASDVEILKRFARVFEQAYIRFLDLKKAEEQAREAQIEAALERTRSKSMLMQHSDEIKNISNIFHEQLLALDIPSEFSYVWLPDETKNEHQFWATWAEKVLEKTVFKSKAINYPLDKTEPYTAICFAAWKNSQAIHESKIPPSEVEKFFSTWEELLSGAEKLKKEFFPEGLYYTEAYMKYGCFGINIRKQLSEAEKKILLRFSKEFERTYTRFLDLQKSEAQAREAQIEAALERIRAKTMAMHKSEQLAETAKVLFEQFEQLGKIPDRMSIGIFKEETQLIQWWVTNQKGSQLNHRFDSGFHQATIAKLYQAWKKGKDSIVVDLTGKDLNDWIRFVRDEVKMEIDDTKMKGRRVQQGAFFSKGILLFSTHEPVSNEIMQLLKRFAKVFNQTFTRFLDLQKAEAQAREAQIEAALERVRSRSLAMHKSNELQEVISVVFLQMQSLGIKADASLINILTEDSKDFYLWIGTVGQTYAQKIRVPYIKHPVFDVFYEARNQGKTFMTNLLTRAEKDSFFEYAFKHSDLRLMPDERKKYVMNSAGFARSFAWSKNSGITIQNYAGIPYTDQENEILKRFARVFEQAYTRFLDVKNAEKQALEAVKQASLDRVRGEIASMRSTEDLNRITPLIWHELNALEVPFIRCGVLIMFNETEIVQTHLSAPDGTAMGIFELPFDSEYIAKNAVKHWRAKTIYKEHWNKDQFLGFMDNLLKLGKIKDPNSYTGAATPPESLFLNFVPFKQGMLYVGNTDPLIEDALDLVKSLAKTFSIAYARYEDFKNIEEAKNKIELTLNELKSAQAQLIQSEKMASLGELTAGIAHEIQNPLNFVNNFSELSNELIEELKSEKLKVKGERDEEFEDEILNDISQNLEKINEHGNRASSIVKGMLQHSRTSSGQKELTDINALADEYLRLSYHGFRAKDKSFNADFKTEFDKSIPKINVIPQDIGRVLLNLINNAFYACAERSRIAVHEKTEHNVNDYKPSVVVSTKLLSNKVEIHVQDNGNGIPDSVKEKIFQPFFTTKPTGQGTGLGLSLSYDIVTKGHKGELKMESKLGEGTEFIIILNV